MHIHIHTIYISVAMHTNVHTLTLTNTSPNTETETYTIMHGHVWTHIQSGIFTHTYIDDITSHLLGLYTLNGYNCTICIQTLRDRTPFMNLKFPQKTFEVLK